MAFSAAHFSLTGHGGHARQWLYTTDDDQATVVASGYFANAADQLIVGDLILATVNTGAAPVPVMLAVTGVSPVTVAVPA